MTLLAAAALAGTEVHDGVVLDRQSGVVLVAAPGGGIDAVAVVDGVVRWHSTAADLPLDVDGGLVAAWADTAEPVLRLVVLDAHTGKVARRCADLGLPAGIPGGVDHHLGDDRHVDADLAGGALQVRWTASTWYAGGPVPTEEVLRAHARSGRGEAACGADGEWTPLPPSPPPPPTPGPPGDVSPLALAIPGGWVSVDCEGGATALSVFDGAGARREVVPVGACAPGATPWLVRASDRGSVAVLSGRAPDAVVFDVHGGRPAPIARFAGEGVGTFVVVGEVVVVARQGAVAAVGPDGAVRWRRPVRTRAHQGPIPQ